MLYSTDFLVNITLHLFPQVREVIVFIHGLLWVYGLLGGAYVITMTLLCVAYYNVTQYNDEKYLWALTVGILFVVQLVSLDTVNVFCLLSVPFLGRHILCFTRLRSVCIKNVCPDLKP